MLNRSSRVQFSKSRTVTVGYATADGTAKAGSDYVSAAGSLSFAPGTVAQKKPSR